MDPSGPLPGRPAGRSLTPSPVPPHGRWKREAAEYTTREWAAVRPSAGRACSHAFQGVSHARGRWRVRPCPLSVHHPGVDRRCSRAAVHRRACRPRRERAAGIPLRGRGPDRAPGGGERAHRARGQRRGHGDQPSAGDVPPVLPGRGGQGRALRIARDRFGLRRGGHRRHPDQPPRDRRWRRDLRPLRRRAARIPGHARGHRSGHRSGPAADRPRRPGTAGAGLRRFGSAGDRRLGGGRRQPVREPRELADRGCGQRQGTRRPADRWPDPPLPGLHPDRCRHQPWQQRRAAGRYARPHRRCEHRDQRTGPGHRFRRPQQPGALRLRPVARRRARRPRLSGPVDGGPGHGRRRDEAGRAPRGRAGAEGGRGVAGGRGRTRAGRRDHDVRRPAGDDESATPVPDRGGPAAGRGRRAGPARRPEADCVGDPRGPERQRRRTGEREDRRGILAGPGGRRGGRQ